MPIDKSKLLLLVILCACSCTTTQYYNIGGWPKLNQKSGLLVLPMKGVSEGSSFQNFETLEEELKSSVSQFDYLPSIEYQILNAGLSRDLIDHADTSTLLSNYLVKELKYEYYIDITLKSSQTGDLIQVETYNDLAESQFELYEFRIIEIETGQVIGDFQVKIKSKAVREGDYELNPVSRRKYAPRAMRAGAKKIKKGLIKV